MWYFTWILGVLLACAFGIINVLWLEAQESLDQQSVVLDPLTKLPSRVEFLGVLENSIEQHHIDHSPFSLLIVSLDAFRTLSQRKKQGAIMDEVVLKLSALIQKETRRPLDTIARYDAATFGIILPGADAKTAEPIAERICKNAVTQIAQKTDDSVISVGVAEFPVHSTGGTNSTIQDQIKTVLQSADEAAKLAQKQGKNRFCCAGEATT